MNIFATSSCPTLSAQSLPDKLVVKMPLETAQMLCTVIIHYRPMTVHNKVWQLTYKWAHLSPFLAFWCRCQPIYSPAHQNHPCTKWCREGDENFIWLYEHGIELGAEYTRRYGKHHKSVAIIEQVGNWVDWVDESPQSQFAQAMPDEFKEAINIHLAYRRYIQTKSYYPGYNKGRDFSCFMEMGEDDPTVLEYLESHVL